MLNSRCKKNMSVTGSSSCLSCDTCGPCRKYKRKRCATHITIHRFCLTILPHRPRMLSRNAKLNTSFTLSPVFEEHSIYLAPISFATMLPCSGVTGVWPCALSIRFVCSSRRRSVLVPTSINGVPSQKWATSGYHCNERDKHEPCCLADQN
jgi:hypothetical protein